jgi:hypothetical protein
LQAALAASARADASLSGLFRAIQQLGSGLGGAREANESLTLELERLRGLLGVASERQRIFERKIAELERVLDRTRKEHAQERGYLIDQQDLFLVKLLDEQELELKQRDSALETLRARIAELERRDQVALAPTLVQTDAAPVVRLVEPDPPVSTASALERAERDELERTAQKLAEDRERARETVARLQAQRDEAQKTVARIGRELDDALSEIHRLKSELGGPRIPLSTRPPPAEMRRGSNSGRASTVAQTLAQLDLEARLARPVVPGSSASASSPVSSSNGDTPRGQPISSILNPPHGNAFSSPIPSRLSPPPARLSPPPARNSPPPEELRRALTSTASSSSSSSSSSTVASRAPVESRSSPLKQKPDASTRPLVGYSLGTGSVEPESLEGATQLSPSFPPSSGKR